PDDGHLAEWSNNLAGRVRLMGDDGRIQGAHDPHRTLLDAHVESFPGGFLASGAVMEGVNVTVPEGWNGTDGATHQWVLAALPDGHTMVGIQLCRANAILVISLDAKALQLNLPNDLYNGFARRLVTA